MNITQIKNRQLFLFSVLLALFVSLTFSVPKIHAQEPPATPTGGSNLPQALDVGTNFSDLSFSTSKDGPPQNYFPIGTPEIFARFNYNNIPAGIVLVRQWYRDGVLDIQRQDPWSSFWGSSGRLTSISIYDYISGLTPGYYHVVISLSGYAAAQIIGDFVIAGYPNTVPPPVTYSSFSNLTVSSSPAGPAIASFPAGTTIVSARWDYANIPVGAILQRDWYLNDVLIRSVQEAWSAYWGASGRLTHIALYDYERGLLAGNYRLIVYLRDNPSVRAETSFVIGGVVSAGVFSNLTFSATPDGPAGYVFPVGSAQIFARWNYANPPPGTTVLRRWYRNGVLWLERREPWMLGGVGTVQNVSIYDFINGLLPGDYYVEISLDGLAGSLVTGYFSIA